MLNHAEPWVSVCYNRALPSPWEITPILIAATFPETHMSKGLIDYLSLRRNFLRLSASIAATARSRWNQSPVWHLGSPPRTCACACTRKCWPENNSKRTHYGQSSTWFAILMRHWICKYGRSMGKSFFNPFCLRSRIEWTKDENCNAFYTKRKKSWMALDRKHFMVWI